PEPTPEPLEEKDPEQIEENMGVDDDESTNDLTQEEAGEQTDRPDTPADGSEGAYNPDTQTFGDTTPEAGTGDNDNDGVVDPVQEQVGAQDTSLESGDGSGNTVQEVVEQADTSTTTDGGERVSDQENRTEEDQHEQTQRQEAHEAEQQTVQEQAPAQEEAAQREEQHQDQTPEQQQQEGADVFASGNF
ncbi:MAG: hypothetical protein Q4D22_04455, partial [Candidatus Saccharibacteria bacterium]|nr:hypothetical protein [Candidatus Saccharibacteria bacterium]